MVIRALTSNSNNVATVNVNVATVANVATH